MVPLLRKSCLSVVHFSGWLFTFCKRSDPATSPVNACETSLNATIVITVLYNLAMRFFLAAGLLGLLGLLQPSLATSAVASDRAQDSQLYRTSLIDAISNSHTFAEQDHATAASQQAEAGEEESYEGALTTGDASFLETGNLVGGCEICGYVVEQKEAMQPFLCRGIRDPAQQQTVSGGRGKGFGRIAR